MLEIVRAVERRPRVLLLDEATSALGANEVEWLGGLVARLRDAKAIVLFISHRWDEVARFCNRVAIMRNGALVSLTDTAEVSEDEAVRLMTGQETVDASFPVKRYSTDAVALATTDLRSAALKGVTVKLRKGEILGLGGLVGQGQGHLLEALFGAHAFQQGSITLAGEPLERLTPQRAIAAGLAYVPQERKTEGLLLDKSVAFNMTLVILRHLRAVFGVVEGAAERAIVGEAIRSLSGGNQQKVLLEKWLLAKPSILLLNDVTRGVDIGTKRHIYALIAGISRHGVGVIWYSTDARELVGVVHRVIVMLGGGINAELTGADVTVDRIIRASVMGNSGGGGDVRAAL